MEELQRTLDKRYDGKPRKVRFKLASSVSGRVLKHVYEDGQEVDSPEEKYPHSFHSHKTPRHLEMGQLCGFQEVQDQGSFPPMGLMAQRINVYRGGANYGAPAQSEAPDGDPNSSVLDFGKIIIYTSNLRIIRAPRREGDAGRRPQPPGGADKTSQGRDRGAKRRPKAVCPHGMEQNTDPQDKGAASGCQHCGGSGCAPCSLCHGSKLSMLANRFNESIGVLRCQACYPDGLERCRSCVP